MKPATKTVIRKRMEYLIATADQEDVMAEQEESSALGRRRHADECREVVAELRALLDAEGGAA